ncbi:MAG: AAA family ATPase [Ardenticatenales bacterium]|nr:AAA family ATPase [Ardenticatenales bacterium]
MDGGGGTIALARLLGIDLDGFRTPAARTMANAAHIAVARPKRRSKPPTGATADLDAFAAARGLDAALLCDTWGVREERFSGRPALRYPTALHIDRAKFLDDAKPKYTWAGKGGGAHWYGLAQLASLAMPEGAAVYVVNGEPAVWAAQLHGIPAVCMCAGEAATSAATGIAADLAAFVGAAAPVRVVYDADATGRSGGPAVAAALAAAGINAVALDLSAAPWPDGIPEHADVGDLAQAVGSGLGAALAALPELAEAADAGGRLPPGTICLADVEPERVRWIWLGWLPVGKLTMLDGDPNLGKSTLALDIAARVSRGLPMPDGARSELDGPRGVVILSAEDGLADTTWPRLDAAGADLERIVAILATSNEEGAPMPTLADVAHVRATIRAIDAALVIVDPLMAYVPQDVNSFKDQDVRRVLTPWIRLATDTGAAVLLVRHLNKSAGTQAIYRGGGSIGIIGAARCGWMLATDPDDEQRRILAHVKGNLGPRPESLALRPVAADNGASRIEWGGTSPLTADELTTPPNPDVRTAKREAADFVRELLADGPVAANDGYQAADDAGIAKRTLKRAHKELGVVATKSAAGWSWSLPAAAEQGCQTDPAA